MPKVFDAEQAELNKQTYAKAPTMAEIDSFLNEAGMGYKQYERFMGMTIGTFGKVKADYRPLPARHWHLIYEKVLPSYGKAVNFRKPRAIPKINPKLVHKVNNSTDVLSKLTNIKG